jgi:nucleoside-diphosphate-sugar epimerase
MKKRILITGVTGFLGSNLAKALLAEGHDIVALKRKSSSLRRLAAISPKIKFFDIEDLDFDEIFPTDSKIDIIIHTATCYGRDNESVSAIFSANTELPLKLLDAGSRAGVKVFINTDTILNKYLNLYSLSKNQFLQWGKYFTLHQHISFVNLRLEHFYGADEDPNKFSAYVINSCLNNVPQLDLTKGEQKRDFMYIDDVVSAYVLLVKKFDTFTDTFTEFDVGSGHSVSIREFVETVHQLTASKSKLAFGALPYRDGEVMNSIPDISGLQALGWQCQYDINTGLRKVIEEERKLAKFAIFSN